MSAQGRRRVDRNDDQEYSPPKLDALTSSDDPRVACSGGVGGSTLPAPGPTSDYQDLVRRTRPPGPPPPAPSEDELDGLIHRLKERQHVDGTAVTADPIESLREMTLRELIPIFVELAEKYSKSSISLQMDASNFLQGGREMWFEFGIGEYRVQLIGTVTSEAIAFQETRFSPEVNGELISGPMLRLRQLTGDGFRDFICERLCVLLRSAIRRG